MTKSFFVGFWAQFGHNAIFISAYQWVSYEFKKNGTEGGILFWGFL